MSAGQQVHAVEGWFTDGPEPRLVGSRCESCGTYFFPKQALFCRNPGCAGADLREVPLSGRGTLWSWAVNHYPAPPPSVVPTPYAVAAVELGEERMVVLGLLAAGADPSSLRLGAEMELVVEPLVEGGEREQLVWKWRPVEEARA